MDQIILLNVIALLVVFQVLLQIITLKRLPKKRSKQVLRQDASHVMKKKEKEEYHGVKKSTQQQSENMVENLLNGLKQLKTSNYQTVEFDDIVDGIQKEDTQQNFTQEHSNQENKISY